MLGDRETLCGVLTLGSEHTTKDGQQIWETKHWTERTCTSSRAAGVRPGRRVCGDKGKRTLVEFGD
jgi:hypothetical protein